MRPIFALAAALLATLSLTGRAVAVPTGAVVLDGSLGPAGALSGPDYNVTAQMGQLRGNNLFQSFSTFNLVAGESATFSGPANVRNILARVTGGSASSIDGALNSSISGANLFFINPAGVMFGPNASVNITGSFVISTANYAKFSDGGIFYAQLGANDNLTSAPVSSFGFLTAHPAPVQFTDAFLLVNPTLGLHVIAGDITVDDTLLGASAGNLTLFSAASAGEVPFDLAAPGAGFAHATNTSFGNIAIRNGSYVAIDSSSGGGHVVIRGGHLTVDNAQISSSNHSAARGGDISLQANQVAIQNGGTIISSATGAGASGDVAVQADDVVVDGTNAAQGVETGILSIASASGAGSITITATDTVSLVNGGQLNASTSAPGGNITVQAASMVIDDSVGSNQITGISTEAFGTTPAAGGLVTVDVAGDVSITGGGAISTFAFSAGDASNVLLHAGTMTVDGLGSPFFTGIESEVSGTGSVGTVTVNVDGLLAIQNGGEIANASFSGASGGDIFINAGSLDIVQTALASFPTGLQTTADDAGNAGAITIDVAGEITVGLGGGIVTATFGAGSAGPIIIHADSLLNDGGTIGSTSLASGGVLNTGNAGSVTVTIDHDLTLRDAGLIDSGTSSAGHAGDVTVQAATLTIDGANGGGLFTGITNQSTQGATGDAGLVTVNVTGALTIKNSGDISGNTFAAGHGGNVQVNAGSLFIDGGGSHGAPTGISANSNSGATADGGWVIVHVDGAASITGSGEVSTTTFTSGNAGTLNLDVGGALAITAGGEVSGGTNSGGTSGAVSVHAGSLTIDGSGDTSAQTGISSQSNTGATGNSGALMVTVDGAMVISAGGEVSSGTRSVANGGDVTVQAGSLTIQNAAGVGHLTGITSETDGTVDAQHNLTGIGGDAGSVTVTITGALVITGGKIDTDTFCFGNAGDVTVHAGSVSIDGSADNGGLTGIFSDSNGFTDNINGLGGNAGTVTVTVDSVLALTSRGVIGAATFTSGQGGNINITAASTNISGASTGITAQAFGTGDGGSINLTGDTVTVADSGLITASASHSNAGTITITAGSSVTLLNGGGITTESEMNGGNISLHVGNLVRLSHSTISAAAQNNGGNVLIDPQFVVLDHSLISANAALGQGGNITIITGNFLNNLSFITATGETNGTINISAPVLDLSGSLLALPAELVSDQNQLRERCEMSVNHEFSTFIVEGRGGSESSPNELQPDFGLDDLPATP